jgi:hypothetical protein
MLRDQMAKTAQLSQFDEELYKVSEGDKESSETAKYLIAVSWLICIYRPRCLLHPDLGTAHQRLPQRRVAASQGSTLEICRLFNLLPKGGWCCTSPSYVDISAARTDSVKAWQRRLGNLPRSRIHKGLASYEHSNGRSSNFYSL